MYDSVNKDLKANSNHVSMHSTAYALACEIYNTESMAKKMIDIQLLSIESDVANTTVQLESVLVALNNFQKNGANKSYQIKLWNNGQESNFVSGIVITEQIKDLPPKRNRDTGAFSS